MHTQANVALSSLNTAYVRRGLGNIAHPAIGVVRFSLVGNPQVLHLQVGDVVHGHFKRQANRPDFLSGQRPRGLLQRHAHANVLLGVARKLLQGPQHARLAVGAAFGA